MIQARNIFFRHNRNGSFQLEDVSLSVPRNSFSVILGPNGSGKTTLLKCLAGFWKMQKGFVFIDCLSLSLLSAKERAKQIAYVPQNHQPVFPYSVLDVVLMGRNPHLSILGFPGKKDRDAAKEALDLLGISHLENRVYTKLSGGERQLVLIARSLAQKTSIMFLDEPVSHLDFKNQVLVLSQIRHIVSNSHLTVLMTLHDPNLASSYADQLILMKNGQAIRQGKPEDIITSECLSELYGMNIMVRNMDNRRWIHVQ